VKTRAASVALLLTLRCFASAKDAAVDQPLAPAKAAAVDAAMTAAMAANKVVGLAIGIIENGQIEYVKGYGFADREKSEPVTTETMFRWASCTKPLAAIAALQLAEKGQLDLDADVRRYVPEFPDKQVKITARQLLCHQSGIPHYTNGTIIPTKRTYDSPHPFIDPIVSLDHFKDSPLLFSPGQRYSYSSYAYLLLSAEIARAGKESFAEQIAKRIARPLGMTSLQPDDPWIDIPHRAAGYVLQKDEVQRSTDTDQSWKWGAGGYISNVVDFARFAKGLLTHHVVSPATERAMWTPQKTNDGKDTSYGLGFEVQVDASGQLVKAAHDGKQEKTRTRFVVYPGRNNGVVVMTNCEWVEPGKFSTLVYKALSGR
jgi:CubicO group peptidase (beta-lactamase class C family)